MSYKYNRYGGVTLTLPDRTVDIPEDTNNADWQRFLFHLSNGGEVSQADPSPVIHGGKNTYERRLTTSGLTPGEIFRGPLAPMTAYTAHINITGIDSGNGNMRVIRADIAAKRLANGAILVGSPAVHTNLSDGSANTWTVTPSVSGNDFILTCIGASGRTVDWFLRMSVETFAPGGVV